MRDPITVNLTRPGYLLWMPSATGHYAEALAAGAELATPEDIAALCASAGPAPMGVGEVSDSDRLEEIAVLLRELVAELRAVRVHAPRRIGPRRSREGEIDPAVQADARRWGGYRRMW